MTKSKKQNKDKLYWSRKRLASFDASYHLAIGKRSNGKTYQGLDRVLEFLEGQKADIEANKKLRHFLYVRRLKEYIVERKARKLFENVQDRFYDALGGYVNYDKRNKEYFLEIGKEKETIGYTTCIEDAFSEKGVPLSDVDVVIFDEFTDYSYMDNEIELFLHFISTLTRNGERKVEIWMFANSISKWCPYFDLFGINPSKLKKGSIAVIKHKNGVTAAIEYCADHHLSEGSVKRHPYLGFDDTPEADMILYGDFEVRKNNTSDVDGIGWKFPRVKIPAYICGMGSVYETSIYVNGKYPILFVRKLNTQNGMVSKDVRFNICPDGTAILNNKKGPVPFFSKISPLMDEDVLKMFDIMYKCIACSRAVYSDLMTATEFETIVQKIK